MLGQVLSGNDPGKASQSVRLCLGIRSTWFCDDAGNLAAALEDWHAVRSARGEAVAGSSVKMSTEGDNTRHV